ncbi:MAG: S-layer homology domain-containing protein [bacterium]|jgi:hypothetical protein
MPRCNMALIGAIVSLIVLLTTVPLNAAAGLAGLDGGISADAGISGSVKYQEVVFVTGEPVVLSGSVSIRPGRPRGNSEETTYNYRLDNPEVGVSLDRQLTLRTTWVETGKQVTAQTEISRVRETITVGRTRYSLDPDSSVWSRSTVTVAEPAVSYRAGNLEGRRVYTINRGEGQVVVEFSGDSTGYEHSWGQVEVQSIYGTVSQKRTWTVQEDTTDEEGRRVRQQVTRSSDWSGTFTCQVSHSTKFDLQYVSNQPTQISFAGGYLETETKEGILWVSYDLPRLNAVGEVSGRRRNQGDFTLNLTGTPRTQRLPVPQYQDVHGRWSSADIMLLGSLGAWNWERQYYHPTTPVNRSEFAQVLACALRLELEEQTADRLLPGQMEPEPPVSPYRDVTTTDPVWPYVKAVSKRGIMEGVAPGYFGAQTIVTRAQAVTAFIRALGFENLGPGNHYATGFSDDSEIPLWARNSFSVARDIGLISGDSFGRARPNVYLTREEAATMLARFVRYLQKDILKDYRDRILLFN